MDGGRHLVPSWNRICDGGFVVMGKSRKKAGKKLEKARKTGLSARVMVFNDQNPSEILPPWSRKLFAIVTWGCISSMCEISAGGKCAENPAVLRVRIFLARNLLPSYSILENESFSHINMGLNLKFV